MDGGLTQDLFQKRMPHMNRTFIILATLLTFYCSSCVSSGTYRDLEYRYNQLEESLHDAENENSELVSKYNSLVDKYNSLLDDYHDTQDSYESQSYKTSEQEDIIDRAKDAVDKLKRDFYYFQRGQCDADDIERDINSIERKLDGWM